MTATAEALKDLATQKARETAIRRTRDTTCRHCGQLAQLVVQACALQDDEFTHYVGAQATASWVCCEHTIRYFTECVMA